MLPGNIRIRVAEPSDVGAIMRMKWSLAMSENAPFVVTATAEQWLRTCFGPSPEFLVLVADQAGTVIGMAICSRRPFPGWDGYGLHLEDLFVEPPHRGRGIAKALLAQVAAIAVAGRATMVDLSVREDNPARKLYRGLGFVRVRNCAIYVASQSVLQSMAGAANPTLSLAPANGSAAKHDLMHDPPGREREHPGDDQRAEKQR